MFVSKKVKFLEKIFPERTFVITTANTTRYLHLSTPMQIIISCCLLGLFAYGTRAYIKYNNFENKMIVKENENLKMENAQYHKDTIVIILTHCLGLCKINTLKRTATRIFG